MMMTDEDIIAFRDARVVTYASRAKCVITVTSQATIVGLPTVSLSRQDEGTSGLSQSAQL